MQKAHMVEAAGASISGRCQKALSKEAAVTCAAGLYAENRGSMVCRKLSKEYYTGLQLCKSAERVKYRRINVVCKGV